MLSIGKIALGQHRYYEQQVAQGADDYYSGRGEAPGEWVGAGAGELGLDGRISTTQFSTLIAGLDPRDPEFRLRSSATDPKVAALDLTFSAPKSVSVLAAVGPDGLARELIVAHELSLRATLEYLEDTAVQVRRGHDGERVEPATGLIAAAYRHRMSRALDPQLHTHVVAANLARGPDGRYTALHGAPLYRAAKTAGFLYQAHLRALISERVGLPWGEVHKGAAELACVPAVVLQEFSKRRHEMLREARKGGIGLNTKAGAESAAIATRDRKRYGVETHTWREDVRARAGKLGLGEAAVRESLREGRQRLAKHRIPEFVDEQEMGHALVGPHGLTERANTFHDRDVLQQFAAAAREGAQVRDVRAQAERFRRHPNVLAIATDEMTTAELVDCEWGLIAAALERAGERCAQVDEPRLSSAITAADRPVTREQATAVRATVGSGDGVSVIQALAGTGKTHTAAVLRQVYERAGFQVIGTAPTARAARELSERAGIASDTLDRLLIGLDQLADELSAKCVVIFDEAGMAPTRLSARLLQVCHEAHAKVIAIGDPRQLPSVQAGGWLSALGRELGTHHLTEVMRQRDPAERRALGALHGGAPGRYLRWAQRAGRIQTHDGRASACEQALEEWRRALSLVGLRQTAMVARDHDTRAALNHAARELLWALGLLGEGRPYGALSIAVGDRVICRRNDALIDVDNGLRGTVRRCDANRVVIDGDGGLMRELPAAYVAEHVEHAYALTGHGIQGATVETAIVVASSRDLTAGWSYTALSRARGNTPLLIYEPSASRERLEFAPAERTLAARRRELLVRVQRRMLQRDDEDLAIDRLPSPGRSDDPGVTGARTVAGERTHESAALRPDRSAPVAGTVAHLELLRERSEQLCAQLQSLPAQQLERFEELDVRAATLSTQYQRLTRQLEGLPERRRRGHQGDLDALERARLTSSIAAAAPELELVLTTRGQLGLELGDPSQIRAEGNGLRRAIAQLAREQELVISKLVKRELEAPTSWVREKFGTRPDEARAQRAWDKRVHEVFSYCLRYAVGNPADGLGLRPEVVDERRDWGRARDAMDGSDRSLSRAT